MLRVFPAVLCVAASTLLSACAVPGGWKGAEAEVAYEVEAKARANSDDYYEIHHEGRIYAFSDQADYMSWRKTKEIPLVVTQIGAGPNGETVKLQLSKADGKAMEKTVGYKGATQRLYEGTLIGQVQGFYGEIATPERFWVFESGPDLHEFKKSGEAPCGITQIGAGPEGKTVVFVQNCKAAAKGKPEVSMNRFRSNYALDQAKSAGTP